MTTYFTLLNKKPQEQILQASLLIFITDTWHDKWDFGNNNKCKKLLLVSYNKVIKNRKGEVCLGYGNFVAFSEAKIFIIQKLCPWRLDECCKEVQILFFAKANGSYKIYDSTVNNIIMFVVRQETTVIMAFLIFLRGCFVILWRRKSLLSLMIVSVVLKINRDTMIWYFILSQVIITSYSLIRVPIFLYNNIM